jgi:hypothetical protein
MTTRTRRRLTLCLVLGLMTLPVEALLLPVALTPDPAEAAFEWAAERSPEELAAAVSEIESYPVPYRRALMSQLDPAARSSVWRTRFQAYLEAQPDLNITQRAILNEAIELASPEAFQPPLRPDLQQRIQQVFGEAQLHLEGAAAAELFVTLGPEDVREANALPIRQQLADRIRGWRSASAGSTPCNCNEDIDTCTTWPEEEWLECSELFTCDMDLTWPMCGPLWSWACVGWCRVLIWPDIY